MAQSYNATDSPFTTHSRLLPINTRDSSKHPPPSFRKANTEAYDPCVVATSSQAPLNDHSRESRFSTVSAQPQGHSFNTSNNANFANHAQPLRYDHSSLSNSQTFSDDLPVRPHMHASTPQMQAAPTLTLDNEHVALNSYELVPCSASVETSLYSTPALAYQELIYTPTPPIPTPRPVQSTFNVNYRLPTRNPKIQAALNTSRDVTPTHDSKNSITAIPIGQPLRSSSSTPSPHTIAQPLYQEQKVALLLRQQQPPNRRSSSAVHAPSPLYYSCSADSETGSLTAKKPVKGRPRKSQTPKSPKRKVARTGTKKTGASTTAVDASFSSTSTAQDVNSRDAEMVANSSTGTLKSRRYSTPPLAVEGSSTLNKTTKRRREYLDDTSDSTTTTKKRCLEDTGYFVKKPSYIAARWLSPEAEEKLYLSSPSYSRPWNRNCCDAPLLNILKPECDTTITFGPEDEILGFTRGVSLARCLDGDVLLDNPCEVISRKRNWPPVFTINIVWFGYLNINYMLQVSLNEGSREMTKAHLAAIIARAYKVIINDHSEEECKQPFYCQAPMLKLGKAGVAFEQIKVTDIQKDKDGIWHPTIEIRYPLDEIHGCLGSEQDISNLDKYYRSIST